MSTAIVMSGGGIRGPLQVGALQSLLEHGIKPDMLAGTSAGSLNAGFMAAMGAELSTIPALQKAWKSATKDKVYPGKHRLRSLARVLDGAEGFFPTDGMRKLIEQNLPQGVTTFGQCKLPCYLTAVDLCSAQPLRVRRYSLGEAGGRHDGEQRDPRAAAAAQLRQPAIGGWRRPGRAARQHRDGPGREGDLRHQRRPRGGGEAAAKGIFEIFMRTLETMVAESIFQDFKRAEDDPTVELHHIHIGALGTSAFRRLQPHRRDVRPGQASGGRVSGTAPHRRWSPRRAQRAAAPQDRARCPAVHPAVPAVTDLAPTGARGACALRAFS